MRLNLWLAALPFLAFAAPAALADTVQIPKTGSPALATDVPTGWTATYDDLGNLTLSAADHSAAIEMSVIAGGEASSDLDTLAAAILKAAQSAPFSSKQPVTVAGLSGEAYASTMLINSVTLTVRVMLIRIDANDVAAVNTLAQPAITPAQAATLKATLSLVHVVK